MSRKGNSLLLYVNVNPFVGTTLKFGKTSGQLPGVDIHFRLRLPVSSEHGWSWDTRTIKTHVPIYIRGALPTMHHWYDTVLTRWHCNSLLDFVSVRLTLRTQGFLKLSASLGVKSMNLHRPTWYASLKLYSPFSSTYRTFVGIKSTCDTITIVNESRRKHLVLQTRELRTGTCKLHLRFE